MKKEVVYITDNPEVTVTAYIHEESNEMKNMDVRPGMLIFPGGGYYFCSDREADPIAIAYLNEGFNCFILRYSLKEKAKYPQPLLDAQKAMIHIRENSQEYHVNPDKIAVIGFSAGGHLAAMLGTSGTIRPNAMILAYPAIISSPKHGWDFPTPVVDKLTPEAFIFHTYEDSICPMGNSMYFAHELQKKKIPFELHIFKYGDHGLSLGNELVCSGNPESIQADYAQWFPLSVRWLKRVLEIRFL